MLRLIYWMSIIKDTPSLRPTDLIIATYKSADVAIPGNYITEKSCASNYTHHTEESITAQGLLKPS